MADLLGRTNAKPILPHVFVYAHTPAFKVSGYVDPKHPPVFCPGSGSTGALYCDTKVRDNLWKSLRDYGVRAYFCGHIHFYTANRIKGYDRPNYEKLYQIVNGLGGAGLDPYYGNADTTHVETANSVVKDKKDGHHGYNLVHVDGKKVTIDLMVWHNKSKSWERLDGICEINKKGNCEGFYMVK